MASIGWIQKALEILLHGWPTLPIRGRNERRRQRQTSKSRKGWESGGETMMCWVFAQRVTNGVNVACSISRTRWSYSFAHACDIRMIARHGDLIGRWIKYPYINKCHFKSSPQNPYIATSSRAPSWVLADRWDRDSPESGCRWGSVVIPWQTSVSKVAVISLTSLCLTAGKPPVLQVNACSTLNGFPQLQWDGEFWNGQPYLSEMLKQLCGEQNRVHLWEVLLARWRLPFPERVPWSVEERVVECVGGFQHLPSCSCADLGASPGQSV